MPDSDAGKQTEANALTYTIQGYTIKNKGVKRLETIHHHAAEGHNPSGEHRKSHHSEKVKADLITRLNRIEGQIRGIKGMIEKDTYCDHVLNQISAVQSALNGVGKLLLAGHLRSCVVERIQEGDLDVIDELLTTVNKLLK